MQKSVIGLQNVAFGCFHCFPGFSCPFCIFRCSHDHLLFSPDSLVDSVMLAPHFPSSSRRHCLRCVIDSSGCVTQCYSCGCAVCGRVPSLDDDGSVLQCTHCLSFLIHRACLPHLRTGSCPSCATRFGVPVISNTFVSQDPSFAVLFASDPRIPFDLLHFGDHAFRQRTPSGVEYVDVPSFVRTSRSYPYGRWKHLAGRRKLQDVLGPQIIECLNRSGRCRIDVSQQQPQSTCEKQLSHPSASSDVEEDFAAKRRRRIAENRSRLRQLESQLDT